MSSRAGETARKRCSHPDCAESYPAHRWGATRATDAGWFLQRDGQAWCPAHVPAWVTGWRERRTHSD